MKARITKTSRTPILTSYDVVINNQFVGVLSYNRLTNAHSMCVNETMDDEILRLVFEKAKEAHMEENK